MFLDSQDPDSGWFTNEEGGEKHPWNDRTFVQSSRVEPELHSFATDMDADTMHWERLVSGSMKARFPGNGTIDSLNLREAFCAGLVSEIYFDC